MFVRAIDVAAEYTRPIHIISRNYQSTQIVPGAATLFFVNADGWALTCRHVAKVIVASQNLGTERKTFAVEFATQTTRHGKRQCEKKYGFDKTKAYDLCVRYVNCVGSPTGFELHMHETVDIALVHFLGFKTLLPKSFAVFAKNGNDLKQGKSLCRLGFPFPEFTNYAYDAATDRINWTTVGTIDTPRFPLEGMVTRHIGASATAAITGFEMSTPGLRGQSGGPAFDRAGVVWGMQSRTNHLDLDFDVDLEVLRNGTKKRVHDSAFLHVGHCVHVDVMKQFMRDKGVAFQEAD